MQKFNVVNDKGFQLTFSNGCTVSVMFGSGNYCEKRDYPIHQSAGYLGSHSSANAEIAIWDKNDRWFDFGGDTIKGFVSPDKVAKVLELVSTLGMDLEEEFEVIGLMDEK